MLVKRLQSRKAYQGIAQLVCGNIWMIFLYADQGYPHRDGLTGHGGPHQYRQTGLYGKRDPPER